MTFEKIREKATAEWESSYRGEFPHILVGTASCGRAAGSLAVADAFNNELAKRNATAKLSRVGCIGLCSMEPLVTIIKPDSFTVCYNNVTRGLF